MAKTINQDIPSEMADAYDTSLHRAAIWIPGSSIRMVRKRVPFYMGHMQNSSTQSPSAAQRLVRAAFKKSCNCFNIQPYSGGATPPAVGPRNRSWWYDQAAGSGLWYYDYFIQQTWPGYYAAATPDWCKLGEPTLIAHNRTRKDQPNTTESGSAKRAADNEEENFVWWIWHEWDFTLPGLQAAIPGYFDGMITGGNLNFWLYNVYFFNPETEQWQHRTGQVHVGQVDYWDPGTLTWNNKPEKPPLKFSRTAYMEMGPYGPWNQNETYHSIDISSEILAAIAAESKYLTVVLTVTPQITIAEGATDPYWYLSRHLTHVPPNITVY